MQLKQNKVFNLFLKTNKCIELLILRFYFFQKIMLSKENLSDQLWFHGFITREEAERILKKNGEFLVREVEKRIEEERFVISTYWDGITHFLVTKEPLVVS